MNNLPHKFLALSHFCILYPDFISWFPIYFLISWFYFLIVFLYSDCLWTNGPYDFAIYDTSSLTLNVLPLALSMWNFVWTLPVTAGPLLLGHHDRHNSPQSLCHLHLYKPLARQMAWAKYSAHQIFQYISAKRTILQMPLRPIRRLWSG